MSHPQLSWLLGIAISLTGCTDSEIGTYDLDESPTDLEQLDQKTDTDVCADFPGGQLDGDDLLTLVNKDEAQQLQRQWAPIDLVPLDSQQTMPGRRVQLRYGVLIALEQLLDEATVAGLDLGIRSGYRGYRTQCLTFKFKVEQHGLEHAKRFSAEPGRSQHQLGTTVDITSARLGWTLEESMGMSPEGLWLATHAYRFGFALSYPRGAEAITGYGYEPWHFRYIGHAAAAEQHEHQLLLEQYLDACSAPMSNLACPREELPTPIPNQGWIGGKCENNVDCASIGPTAFCSGPSGSGFCTLPCTEFCPDREGANSLSFCADTDQTGMGFCYSQCDQQLYGPTGCRAGYHCTQASRPSRNRDANICVPIEN